ncbi:MAG: hypothetical protein PGN13_03685 [Patulibacter minatonensis]
MGTTRYIATTLVLALAVFASAIVLLDAALGGKTGGDDLGIAAGPGSDDDRRWPDRPAPWALLGTVDHGRALRVFPLSRRPACGRFRAVVRERSHSVGLDVIVDYAQCPGPDPNVDSASGPTEDITPRTIEVPLAQPLDGRTVGGSMLTFPERDFGDRVIDLRGLPLTQAEDVTGMLHADLDVHGPEGRGATVSRQRPLNIGPGEHLPGATYKVFTRAG